MFYISKDQPLESLDRKLNDEVLERAPSVETILRVSRESQNLGMLADVLLGRLGEAYLAHVFVKTMYLTDFSAASKTCSLKPSGICCSQADIGTIYS